MLEGALNSDGGTRECQGDCDENRPNITDILAYTYAFVVSDWAFIV